jgi:hypothetical protein
LRLGLTRYLYLALVPEVFQAVSYPFKYYDTAIKALGNTSVFRTVGAAFLIGKSTAQEMLYRVFLRRILVDVLRGGEVGSFRLPECLRMAGTLNEFKGNWIHEGGFV